MIAEEVESPQRYERRLAATEQPETLVEDTEVEVEGPEGPVALQDQQTEDDDEDPGRHPHHRSPAA